MFAAADAKAEPKKKKETRWRAIEKVGKKDLTGC